jgi:hypothetical protein
MQQFPWNILIFRNLAFIVSAHLLVSYRQSDSGPSTLSLVNFKDGTPECLGPHPRSSTLQIYRTRPFSQLLMILIGDIISAILVLFTYFTFEKQFWYEHFLVIEVFGNLCKKLNQQFCPYLGEILFRLV